MKQLTSTEWISHFLASDPPRSKSLVMTIFGDSIVPHGGAIWLGSLIELLAPFGVNDRALRTSVFRLAQEGWLLAHRDGRRSSYAILPEALPRFERAYRRIYDVPAVNWDGKWTLLMAGPDGLDAPNRALVRKQLLWEGFATIGTGVYAHPAGDFAVLDEILGRAGVREKLFVFSAGELPQVGSRPLRELVDESWDLSDVAAGYRHFIEGFAPLQALLGERVEPEQAFVIRTLLIHAYRRVQLHDPMLPVELLPQPWPGVEAYEVARALYLATFRAAEDHIMATLRSEDVDANPAEDSFYQRFGGLPRA